MNQYIMNMVKQERIAWITVIFTLIIAGYYFSQVPLSIPPEELHSRHLRKVITFCIGLVVLSEIITSVLCRTKSGVTEEDERDKQIQGKAIAIAYRTLFGFTSLLIVQLVIFARLSIGSATEEATRHLPVLSEVSIAHVLLGILIIASVSQQIAKIVYYRRGY